MDAENKPTLPSTECRKTVAYCQAIPHELKLIESTPVLIMNETPFNPPSAPTSSPNDNDKK